LANISDEQIQKVIDEEGTPSDPTVLNDLGYELEDTDEVKEFREFGQVLDMEKEMRDIPMGEEGSQEQLGKQEGDL